MQLKKIRRFIIPAILSSLLLMISFWLGSPVTLGWTPFVVWVCLTSRVSLGLWCACLTGLTLDMATGELPFGIIALSYTLGAAVILWCRYVWFVSSIWTVAFFAPIFSLVSQSIIILWLRYLSSYQMTPEFITDALMNEPAKITLLTWVGFCLPLYFVKKSTMLPAYMR